MQAPRSGASSRARPRRALTNETIVADTWNNTGSFYIRINGKNGASSLASPFTLGVTLDPSVCDGVDPAPADTFEAPAGGYETLVLADYAQMATAGLGNSASDQSDLETQLDEFIEPS